MNRISKIALSLLLTCAGIAGVYSMVKKFSPARPVLAELRDWGPRQLAGLALEAPGGFESTPLDLGVAQEFVESSELQVVRGSGCEIDVLRTVYKPGVDVSFDGAVQGAINGIAQLDGIRNLQHTAAEATVSGKAARRLSMSAERWRKSLRVEAALIADGQSFYQVQAIFDPANARVAADVERLLASVRLAP